MCANDKAILNPEPCQNWLQLSLKGICRCIFLWIPVVSNLTAVQRQNLLVFLQGCLCAWIQADCETCFFQSWKAPGLGKCGLSYRSGPLLQIVGSDETRLMSSGVTSTDHHPSQPSRFSSWYSQVWQCNGSSHACSSENTAKTIGLVDQGAGVGFI